MSLPDLCSTSLWVRFFTESGIPHSVAANYAVTFVDNRITRNMLLDLNKEILQDMGITVMGDVIAILKHAKVVHAQMTREKVYQNEPSVASVSPVKSARRSSTVPRILEDNHVVERQLSDLADPVTTSNPNIRRLVSKRTVGFQEQQQAKKVRRVLPEHEGPYKILMPSGSTPKTRKLLAQLGSKESVFERLGDEGTDMTDLAAAVTPTITGIRKLKPGVTKTSVVTSSSVFQRLGPGKSDCDDVNDVPVKSVFKRVVLEPTKKTQIMVPTKPILKKRLVQPKVSAAATQAVRFSKTTAVARIGSQGIMAKRNLATKKSIYSRLGAKTVQKVIIQKKSTLTSEAKMINLAPATKKVFGNRVGLPTITIVSADTTTTSTGGKTSVFRRLGPAVDV